jgi:hypothetical protein
LRRTLRLQNMNEQIVNFMKRTKLTIKEINRRIADIESGKVKGLTLAQVELTARKNYRNKKKA